MRYDILQTNKDVINGKPFDIFPAITNCALDIICGKCRKTISWSRWIQKLDRYQIMQKIIGFSYNQNKMKFETFWFVETAMGTHPNAQNEENSEYVDAVFK